MRPQGFRHKSDRLQTSDAKAFKIAAIGAETVVVVGPESKGRRLPFGRGPLRPFSHLLQPFIGLQEAFLKRFTAMFYGAMVWDPWLIVAQIACLQCLLYLSLGVYLWLFVGSHVHHFTLRYFFDYELLSFGSFDGWCTIVSFLLNYSTG